MYGVFLDVDEDGIVVDTRVVMVEKAVYDAGGEGPASTQYHRGKR